MWSEPQLWSRLLPIISPFSLALPMLLYQESLPALSSRTHGLLICSSGPKTHSVPMNISGWRSIGFQVGESPYFMWWWCATLEKAFGSLLLFIWSKRWKLKYVVLTLILFKCRVIFSMQYYDILAQPYNTFQWYCFAVHHVLLHLSSYSIFPTIDIMVSIPTGLPFSPYICQTCSYPRAFALAIFLSTFTGSFLSARYLKLGHFLCC